MLPEKRERRRGGERYVEAGDEGALRRSVGVVFLLDRRRRRRGVDPFDREDLPVAAVLSDRTREVARLAGLARDLYVRPLGARGKPPLLTMQIPRANAGLDLF